MPSSAQLGEAQLGDAQLGGDGYASNDLVANTGISSSATLGADGIIAGPVTATVGITSSPGLGTNGYLAFEQSLIATTGIVSSSGLGTNGALLPQQFVTATTGITSSPALGANGLVYFQQFLTATSGITSSPSLGTNGAIGLTIRLSAGIGPYQEVYGPFQGIGGEASRMGTTGALIGGGFAQLFINGLDRTTYLMTTGANIRRQINGPGSAQFKLSLIGSYRPLFNQEVVFYIRGKRKFGGFIRDIKQEPMWSQNQKYVSTIDCVDYSMILDRRVVKHDYRGETSLKSVLEHIVANFLDGEGIGLVNPFDAELPGGSDSQVNEKTVREALDYFVGDQAGLIWHMDQFKNIHVVSSLLEESPVLFNFNGENLMSPDVTYQGRLVRTVQGVRTSTLVAGVKVETMAGSATRYWYSLDYPISQSTVPLIKLNGTPQAVVLAAERGLYDHFWYFTPEESKVWRNPAKPALTSSDTIEVTYAPISSDVIWFSDDDAVDVMAARSGGSGRIEAVSEGRDVTDETVGVGIAESLQRRNSGSLITLSGKTDEDGVEPGQVVRFDLEQPFLKTRALVEDVSYQEIDGAIWRTTLRASSNEPLVIVSVSNETPVLVRTEFPHGLVDNQTVSIFGVEGTTTSNVENWRIRVKDDDEFWIPGVAGNGAYVPYTGYVVVGMPVGVQKVAEISAGPTVEVTTTNPHGYDVPSGDPIDDYTPQDYAGPNPIGPTVSLNGATGINDANGQWHTAIPIDETTVILGPEKAWPLLPIVTSVSGSGSSDVEVEFDGAHDLSTGDIVLIDNTGSVPLDGTITTVTSTGSTTITLDDTSTVTVSAPVGTVGTFADAIEISSITGFGVSQQVQVVTATPHGLTTGQRISISKAVGWEDVKGVYFVDVIDSTTLELDGIFATGSASSGVLHPWPSATGTLTGDTATIGTNWGLNDVPISSISGSTVITAVPHGIDHQDTITTFTGPSGANNNSMATPSTPTTFTASPAPSPTATSTLPTGGDNVDLSGRGGPARTENPRTRITTLFTRTRRNRNLNVDTDTILLTSAMAGYSSAPLQTGIDVAEKTAIRDGVLVALMAVFRTPPEGSAIKCDVKVNGVTIFEDSDKLTYPVGVVSPRRYLNLKRNFRRKANDRITVDILQVGSSFAGCDGEIRVVWGPTSSV